MENSIINSQSQKCKNLSKIALSEIDQKRVIGELFFLQEILLKYARKNREWGILASGIKKEGISRIKRLTN